MFIMLRLFGKIINNQFPDGPYHLPELGFWTPHVVIGPNDSTPTRLETCLRPDQRCKSIGLLLSLFGCLHGRAEVICNRMLMRTNHYARLPNDSC